MEEKKETSLFKKFLEFAIGNGFILILGFISSPIITRLILPEEYGKYDLFNTVTTLVILVMMMGIDQAYVRYYHEESSEDIGLYLRKCVKLPLTFNFIVGGILLIMYKFVSNFIIEETSFLLVVLILLHSIFSIISNFSMIHIRMKQRGKLYSFLSVINKSCFLIFTLILFSIFKNNYIVLVLSAIFSNAIMGIVAIIYERNDWFKINKGNKPKITNKELIIYGYPFIFSMAITWVFQSIDKVSLKMFSGYEEIGLYAGAMTIIGLLNVFQSAFTVFWTPVAYEKYSKDKENKEFFIEVNKIVSLAMLVLSIGLISCKDIIVALLGSKYSGAQFIFPFLVLMPIMYTISETTVLGINFKKKTKYHIYIAIFSAISNVIGNLILVPKYGATGAAISTGLSYVVFFSARTYFAKRFYKVDYALGRFAVSVIAVYILAAYSSVNTFNIGIILISIFSIIVVFFMYRDILRKLISLCNKVLKRKMEKNNKK
ncbi:oligosaccharide flippase family protein [Clostridium carnis]